MKITKPSTWSMLGCCLAAMAVPGHGMAQQRLDLQCPPPLIEAAYREIAPWTTPQPSRIPDVPVAAVGVPSQDRDPGAWAGRPCSALAAAGDCGFYACREKALQALSGAGCGEAGYYLGYGERYCRRFTDMRPFFSADGRRWLVGTRQCLMRYMDSNVALSADCGGVREIAFMSHPQCYANPGPEVPSICDLPVRDWPLVLAMIDPQDFDLEQHVRTKVECIRYWLGGAAIGGRASSETAAGGAARRINPRETVDSAH